MDAKGMDFSGTMHMHTFKSTLTEGLQVRRGKQKELFSTIFLKVSFLHILNIHF